MQVPYSEGIKRFTPAATGGVNEDGLALDGHSGHCGHECIDAFECSSQGLHGREVYFDNFDSSVICSWLFGSCENRDLKSCIDKCFEDMRPKAARSLVKMSVIPFMDVFKILTPAIATDFISDIAKKGGISTKKNVGLVIRR